MSRKDNAARAEQLLRASPMTRFELECKLGVSKQRVSEALRDVGAHVIGSEPRECRGRPMPIYALEQPEAGKRIGAVSSVWELGEVA